MAEKATFEGKPVLLVLRWAKNGRLYKWSNPTQKAMDDLEKRYRVDQMNFDDEDDGWVIWLQW